MKRQNTSGLAPLTRDFSGTKCGTTFHPTPTHDVHAEQILFNMYLREKQRAERFLQQRDEERAKFTAFRARGVARAIAKTLKISHSDGAGK